MLVLVGNFNSSFCIFRNNSAVFLWLFGNDLFTSLPIWAGFPTVSHY